jgi:hypothetical protein
MKPIQSNVVLANVLDWIEFSVPGNKKWGIGLLGKSNPGVLDQMSVCWDWDHIAIPTQYPKSVGHVFIGYQIETSPNTQYWGLFQSNWIHF